MIGIGIVGLGRAARTFHYEPVLAESTQFRIQAVFDQSESRTKQTAEEMNAKACASLEELLNDGSVQVVLVTTPPTFHCEVAVASLEAGKHVIVEKPLALSVRECKLMIEAAKKADKLLTVHQNRRWDRHYRGICQAIRDGLIGVPYVYNIRMMSYFIYKGVPEYIPYWEARKQHGGGTLFSWGPHLVDQLLQLHTARPKTVYGRTHSEGWEFDGEAYSSSIIGFEDGATAQVEICYATHHKCPYWYVIGTEGSLVFQSGILSVKTHPDQGTQGKSEEMEIPLPDAVGEVFYQNIYEAVTNGEKLLVDPREVIEVIAILEGTSVSAEQGKIVEL